MSELTEAQELRLSEKVAEEINRRYQTDYRVYPETTQNSIIDTYLVSESDPRRRRGVQVTTIPVELSMREDADYRRKLREDLTSGLVVGGMAPSRVSVLLRGSGNVSRRVRDRLVALILQGGRTAVDLSDVDLYWIDPELSERVTGLSVYPLREPSSIDVGVLMPEYMRQDDSLIYEGIREKAKRYGGPAAVRELTLVIGAGALIDQAQIDAFQTAYLPDDLPFSEIWLVSRFHGVTPLKAVSDRMAS